MLAILHHFLVQIPNGMFIVQNILDSQSKRNYPPFIFCEILSDKDRNVNINCTTDQWFFHEICLVSKNVAPKGNPKVKCSKF